MLTIAATALHPPSTGISNIIPLLLGGSAFGAVVTVLWQAWQRHRTGQLDDAQQIRSATKDAVDSSNILYAQYKVELEDARRQLNEYLTQLISVNRELGQTMGRITKLEQDLTAARGEVVTLREELARAYEQRDHLRVEVRQLQQRIQALES